MPNIYSFNVCKMRWFLPLNLILISLNAYWQNQLNNFFWKIPVSHIIQNHWKKIALLWALQFQFNWRTYPIRQLSSLKLPMDSQCIQASSSKSIFVPNVRRNFQIYISRQSATLKKMSKWYFVWQYQYGCVPLHIDI